MLWISAHPRISAHPMLRKLNKRPGAYSKHYGTYFVRERWREYMKTLKRGVKIFCYIYQSRGVKIFLFSILGGSKNFSAALRGGSKFLSCHFKFDHPLHCWVINNQLLYITWPILMVLKYRLGWTCFFLIVNSSVTIDRYTCSNFYDFWQLFKVQNTNTLPCETLSGGVSVFTKHSSILPDKVSPDKV